MKKADRDILGILTETRTVYTVKVGKRSRSFLTPDGAREGFFRMSAARRSKAFAELTEYVRAIELQAKPKDMQS